MPELLARGRFIEACVDTHGLKGFDDVFVRQMDDLETERAKLFERGAGKFSGKHYPEKRSFAFVFLSDRKHRALNFLRLGP